MAIPEVIRPLTPKIDMATWALTEKGSVYKRQKSHNLVGGPIILTVQSFHGHFRYISNIIRIRTLIGIKY